MKKLRLLIYESDNELRLEKQIEKSLHGSRDNGNGVKITAIDLDPLRITILQLIRLFMREQSK